MKIGKTLFKNLFSYKKLSIDLGNLDFAVFVGDTGSGKTSIFDILTWIWYGKTARKKYKAILRDIPKKQRTGVGVSNIIDDAGNKIKIIRKTGYGKGVYLFKNGKKVKLRNKTLLQQEIEKIIGYDYDAFLNVVYFSQGDIGKFLSSDSSERIKIISKVLNLEPFDLARKNIQKLMNKIDKRINKYFSKVEAYIDSIGGIKIDDMISERKMIKVGLEKMKKDFSIISNDMVDTREKKQIDDEYRTIKIRYHDQRDYISSQLNKYSKNILSLKNSIKNEYKYKSILDKITNKENINEYNRVNSEIKIINNKILSYERKKYKIVAKKELYNDDLSDYKDISGMAMNEVICPTCKTKLNHSHAKYIKVYIDDVNNKIIDCDSAIKKYDNKISNLNKKLFKFNKKLKILNKDVAVKIKYESKLKDINDKKKELKEIKSERKEYKSNKKKELNEFRAKLKRLKQDLNYYNDYDTNKLDDLLSSYSELQDKINKSELKFNSLDYRINHYFSIKKKIDLSNDKIKKYKSKYEDIKWWYDNIPQIKLDMIMEVMPFIENQTNKYLSQLLPGRMIKFNVNPNKASNKVDVYILDYVHNVKRIFEGWSGGEKGKMSLSVYLALNKMACMRYGKKINFVILDEKLANLDSKDVSKVLEMLQDEYKDRKIFTISHVRGIEEEFNQVVQIEKVNHISRIKKIGYKNVA